MSDAPPPHPGRLLAVLASPPRLRVLSAAVLGGPLPVEELARVAGLERRAARRAVDALAAVGLLSDAGDGRWAAEPGALRAAGGRAARLAVPADELPGSAVTAGQAAVARSFFSSGKLRELPAQRTKRLVVLDVVAQRFEPGRTYEEAAVNEMLGEVHPDYATLRRSLVDEGFLERRDRGYWRSGGTFEVG